MPCLWSIGWHHLFVISAIFFFFYGHNNQPSNCLFVKRCYICWSDSQAKTTVFGTIIYAQQIYWFMMRFPRFFLTLRSLHIKVRALNNHYFVSSCKLFSQHLFRIEWWDLLFWSYDVDVNCIHWDHNIFKFCWMLNLHVVAIYWSPLPATDFTKLCQKCSSWWWWRTDLKVVGRQEAWSRDGLGVRAFALHQCGEFSASTLWVCWFCHFSRGALEYIRNRKTVQIIIENCKTEIDFDQSRKPQTKLEKTCRLSEVHIFRRGTGKTPNCIE